MKRDAKQTNAPAGDPPRLLAKPGPAPASPAPQPAESAPEPPEPEPAVAALMRAAESAPEPPEPKPKPADPGPELVAPGPEWAVAAEPELTEPAPRMGTSGSEGHVAEPDPDTLRSESTAAVPATVDPETGSTGSDTASVSSGAAGPEISSAPSPTTVDHKESMPSTAARRLKRFKDEHPIVFFAVPVVVGAIGLVASVLQIEDSIPCSWKPEQQLYAPYNVVVANIAVDYTHFPAAKKAITPLAEQLNKSLYEYVSSQLREPGLIDVGRPCGSRAETFTSRRADDLERSRKAKKGDIAVSLVLSPREYHSDVRVEFSIGGDRLHEAAELTGYLVFDELDVGDLSTSKARAEVQTFASEQVTVYVRLLRGLVYYSTGDYDRARVELAPLAKSSSSPLTTRFILLLLGNAAGRQNKFPVAKSYYEKALALDPSYPRAKLGIAEIVLQNGMSDCRHLNRKALQTAYGIYQRVFRFVTDRYDRDPGKTWLRMSASESNAHIGLLYWERGHSEDAIPWYTRALELAKDQDRIKRFEETLVCLRQGASLSSTYCTGP